KKFWLKDLFGGNYMPRESFRVDTKLLGGFELNFLPQNMIIGKDHIDGGGSFFIYDEEARKKRWIDYFPEMPNSPGNEKLALAYDSFLDVNEDRGLIIQAMKYFNRLNLYDMEGNLKNSVVIGEEVLPDFSKKSVYLIPQDVISFTVDMHVSDSYVYLLYA